VGSIKEGARQAVENCLKVKPGEKVVIITDKDTLKIGCAIRREVEKITNEVQFFIMEDFGKRPLDFPSQIDEALKRADVSFYVAQGPKGELQTFREPMLKTVNANKKLRHAHMIGITPQIMEDGMCSDYREIQRISKLVYEQIKDAPRIRVVTEKGTNLVAEFSPKLHWKICDGNIKPNNWSNLPDGEVFTSPVNVNGRVVIDGCLGDFFSEKYGSLEDTPITIEIENGRAKKEGIRCDNKELKREFIKYLFETDENSNRVGEFAIGTNVCLTKLIGNLLQDEKFPGVHIAFGSPYPAETGADWDSKAHIDGVIRNTTIYVNGKMMMDEGKFLLSN